MFTNPKPDTLPIELPWPFPLVIWLRRIGWLGVAALVPLSIFTLATAFVQFQPRALFAVLAFTTIVALADFSAVFLVIRAITKSIRELRKLRAVLESRRTEVGNDLIDGLDDRIAGIEAIRDSLEDSVLSAFNPLRSFTSVFQIILAAQQRIGSAIPRSKAAE